MGKPLPLTVLLILLSAARAEEAAPAFSLPGEAGAVNLAAYRDNISWRMAYHLTKDVVHVAYRYSLAEGAPLRSKKFLWQGLSDRMCSVGTE